MCLRAALVGAAGSLAALERVVAGRTAGERTAGAEVSGASESGESASGGLAGWLTITGGRTKNAAII